MAGAVCGPPVILSDVCVGCILYLPHLESATRLKSDHPSASKTLLSMGVGHPVVVLRVHNEGISIEAEFATLVSWKKMSLKEFVEKWKTDQSWKPHTPLLHQGIRTLEKTPRYTLENAQQMLQQSFFFLPHYYRILASHLRVFADGKRAFDRRLDHHSYRLLMKKMKLEPQMWVETESVRSGQLPPPLVDAPLPIISCWNTPPSWNIYPSLPLHERPSPPPLSISICTVAETMSVDLGSPRTENSPHSSPSTKPVSRPSSIYKTSSLSRSPLSERLSSPRIYNSSPLFGQSFTTSPPPSPARFTTSPRSTTPTSPIWSQIPRRSFPSSPLSPRASFHLAPAPRYRTASSSPLSSSVDSFHTPFSSPQRPARAHLATNQVHACDQAFAKRVGVQEAGRRQECTIGRERTGWREWIFGVAWW